MRFGQNLDNEWSFSIDGQVVKIPVQGNRIANDGEQVRHWCLAGFGIAYKANLDVEADIAEGKLIPLLAPYLNVSSQLQIIYPQSNTMPRRVRMLIDYIAKQITV